MKTNENKIRTTPLPITKPASTKTARTRTQVLDHSTVVVSKVDTREVVLDEYPGPMPIPTKSGTIPISTVTQRKRKAARKAPRKKQKEQPQILVERPQNTQEANEVVKQLEAISG